MFNGLLKSRKNKQASQGGEQITRRRYTRRKTDQCISLIDGHAYPVEDWGIGGLLISGDDRLFALGREYDVMLKFKLRDNVLEVRHKAKVSRKNKGRIGMEFTPLTEEIRDKLKAVVDDYVARQFVSSQMG